MALLQLELARLGIPARVEGGDGGGVERLEVDASRALVTVELRPAYCDRGRFIVKAFPRGELGLSLDAQDGFPRYYFGVRACASEIHAWMEARGLGA